MSKPVLEFWLEFASTYSYLAAHRLTGAQAPTDVEVRYRPFLLGPIFGAQGWDTSPFNIYPAKGRHMWRDMERLCADAGLPFTRPTVFPVHSVLAARVACAADGEPWQGNFIRAVYHAHFGEDRDIGKREEVAAVLGALGQDPDTVFARAESPAIKTRLRENTDRAMELGVFGAPSFVVNGELFWGADRLDQALRWAREGR